MENTQPATIYILQNPFNTPWTYLMGLYSGGLYGGAYIREEKHFNLQSVKLAFLFLQYKARISAFSRRGRCEICSKLTIDTSIRKVNDKVKNKDTIDIILTSLGQP